MLFRNKCVLLHFSGVSQLEENPTEEMRWGSEVITPVMFSLGVILSQTIVIVKSIDIFVSLLAVIVTHLKISSFSIGFVF